MTLFGRKGRPRRIFMGLTEVSGYYASLKRGFEEIGVPALFVDLSDHRFRYGHSNAGWAAGTHRRIMNAFLRRRRGVAVTTAYRIASLLLRAAIFARAAATCDVFVFGYLSSFFHYRELPLLKRLGKRVIYVFHGSDSRPPYLDGYQQKGMSVAELVAMTRAKKRSIGTIERYADFIVCTPIQAHLHERPIIAFQSLGTPATNDGKVGAPVAVREGFIRIVHAPSAPENKGTAAVRRAIETLRAEGHHIDYIELMGRSNDEVLAELQACDFVVDQMNGEGPFGGLATEAAFFGKAVVLGTHTDDIWRMFPPGELPPLARCGNEQSALEAMIRKLIVDVEFRRDIGRRAGELVRTRWSPRQVASRFLKLVSGEAPESWTYDPHALRYIYGAGLPLERLRAVLADYIGQGGVEALQLADKPELARDIAAFARGERE